MNNLITITPSADLTNIAIAHDAIALKARVIAGAKEIATVGSAFDAACAADSMKSIDGVIKAIDGSHKDAKAPFLEITRQLDAVKREMLDGLTEEKSRLSRILGAWQAEERDKQRRAENEARMKAQEEIMRAAEEKAKVAQQFELSDSEVADSVNEINQQTACTVAAIHEEAATKSQPVKGIKVRTRLRWEIIAGWALAEGCPSLVIPANCMDYDCPSPLKGKITALNTLENPLPGTRVWEETIATL